MHSQHGGRFNHDPWADGYDEDVRDESHPIRAGYNEVLRWVAEQSGASREAMVLDLGCGTGNLAARLPPCKRLICVDISEKMLALARHKLAGRDDVEFIQADLLGYFDRADPPAFDAVVSTYAMHHLTEDEKALIFRRIEAALRPGGRAVFGDLMFRDIAARDQQVARFRAQGQGEIVEDIEEEFFWNVTQADLLLGVLGFRTETRQVSALSWVIAAVKEEPPHK
jgi:putative AdoMet-dependent methyltransferase